MRAGRHRPATRYRLLLAAAVPVLAFARPAWADQLAAVAAIWLVLGRTAVSRLERGSYVRAAGMQEYCDCKLFDLPWNESLVGPEPRPVDVAADAARFAKRARLRRSYDLDLEGLAWPLDVLFCQLQSSSWSRRDHQTYATLLWRP